MDIGKRIDLHTHSLLSDGALLPSEAMRYASTMGFAAMAITDHVDYSNIESVIEKLLLFSEKQGKYLDVVFVPGVEITHADPRQIPELASEARKMGAKIVVCHGETVAEPVIKGTNNAAVSTKGLVDILAHPGKITEEDALLAKENGIYLEITSRKLHNATNRHVVSIAKKTGAKLLVNTDSHLPENYITQEQAYKLAKSCGLREEEAKLVVNDNPRELLEKLGFRIP